MDKDPETLAREAAEKFSVAMAAFWRKQLGARLLGVYRIGSLAHGGFSRRYSDIDLAVMSDDGLTDEELAEARKAAATLSPAHGGKLSIFWSNRGFTMGRLPPLDRADYLDHAVPILEQEQIRPSRPRLEEVRDYLRGAPFAAWREQVRRFAAATRLGPDDHKPYLRALLYPARFVFSWSTGAMASNDRAVAFLRETAPDGLDVDLVERALGLRQRASDLDALFPERATLGDQFEACTRFMATQ